MQIGCPACGSKNYDFQFKKHGFTYVLCRECKTLFVNPRPSLKALVEFYTRSRSAIFWVEEFFKPVAEARRQKIFRPRAEYVKNTISVKPDGTIGDIGSGFGIFLEELGKIWASPRMVAIEPSPDMVEICKQKKLEVIPSTIEDVKGWEGEFNLLTAFELFEHLFDPNEFLKKSASLLAPGGYLLVTTLNSEGFDVQVLWEKSKSMIPPLHLNFFNPGSISLLLKSAGFVVEEIATPGLLDWDIVDGMIENGEFDAGRFWKLLAEKGCEQHNNP